LRYAAAPPQEGLVATLEVVQDTISGLEKRSDMLLSTLRHFIDAMGGKLEFVTQFPDRPPVVIEHHPSPVRARKLRKTRKAERVTT